LAGHLSQSCLNFKMMVTNAKAGMLSLQLLDGATVGVVAMVWRSRSRVMDQLPKETPTHLSTSTSTTPTSMESLLRRARSMKDASRLRRMGPHPTAASKNGPGTQTTPLCLAVTSKLSRQLNICPTFPILGVTAACLDMYEVMTADGWSLRMREGHRSYSPMIILLGFILLEAKSRMQLITRMVLINADCIAAGFKHG
jgi:hypothetical protein